MGVVERTDERVRERERRGTVPHTKKRVYELKGCSFSLKRN